MKPTAEQISKLPKWAQEHILNIQSDARRQSALRWTPSVSRDVPPPTDFNALSKGWNVVGSFEYGRVEKACSSPIFNGSGWENTSSQGSRSLFSTRLLALKALRHGMEVECATRLAGIDLQIEQESQNPTIQ